MIFSSHNDREKRKNTWEKNKREEKYGDEKNDRSNLIKPEKCWTKIAQLLHQLWGSRMRMCQMALALGFLEGNMTISGDLSRNYTEKKLTSNRPTVFE